jgi:hypothetical protein
MNDLNMHGVVGSGERYPAGLVVKSTYACYVLAVMIEIYHENFIGLYI